MLLSVDFCTFKLDVFIKCVIKFITSLSFEVTLVEVNRYICKRSDLWMRTARTGFKVGFDENWRSRKMTVYYKKIMTETRYLEEHWNTQLWDPYFLFRHAQRITKIHKILKIGLFFCISNCLFCEKLILPQ